MPNHLISSRRSHEIAARWDNISNMAFSDPKNFLEIQNRRSGRYRFIIRFWMIVWDFEFGLCIYRDVGLIAR